ncbi:hypothetical protein [Faecalispora anaeroviscerum]|uniref:hypothetical protein n=1 Tax=Faecalispora anaeroviscerum TaxID=2991836 RepID=UPI0024BA2D22|nr:hypothetical protein [Faecalispora anaeroviscerum]
MILHSDCNSFYTSVENLYRPEMQNQPAAVGCDVEHRRGIILAKISILQNENEQQKIPPSL